MSKEKAKIDLWMKEIAPSNELRTWFSHDPEKWEPFKKRYEAELKDKRNLLDIIIQNHTNRKRKGDDYTPLFCKGREVQQ